MDGMGDGVGAASCFPRFWKVGRIRFSFVLSLPPLAAC